MALLEGRELLLACALALLCREGAWLPAQAVAQRMGLTEDGAEELLTALAQRGCAESCPWPGGGGVVAHYRATSLGRCLLESQLEQYRRDRERLDALLLGQG